MSPSPSPAESLSTRRRCTATTRQGQPCKAWAVRGSNPPRCSAHGGGSGPVGAPIGNLNALKHGFYAEDPGAVTIDDAIAGLVDKLERLDALIATDTLSPEQVLRLFSLYTQASSRLGRLLRARHTISGDAADGLSDAVAKALEEVGEILGVEGGL